MANDRKGLWVFDIDKLCFLWEKQIYCPPTKFSEEELNIDKTVLIFFIWAIVSFTYIILKLFIRQAFALETSACTGNQNHIYLLSAKP